MELAFDLIQELRDRREALLKAGSVCVAPYVHTDSDVGAIRKMLGDSSLFFSFRDTLTWMPLILVDVVCSICLRPLQEGSCRGGTVRKRYIPGIEPLISPLEDSPPKAPFEFELATWVF